MTKNKRYEGYYDALNDARIEESGIPPCTLPMQAYGPQDVEWHRDGRPAVWAWVSWPHKPAERVEAWAVGWNDRVVVVEWESATGTRNTVVWRNAVSQRAAGTTKNPPPTRDE